MMPANACLLVCAFEKSEVTSAEYLTLTKFFN